jgi:hypothetical protein
MTRRRAALAAVAACLAASVTAPGAGAAPGCLVAQAAFDYSTTSASATFVVGPSCFGSRADVGDLRVHYTATRCDDLGCVSLPERTVTCRWSTRACVQTLAFDHARVEHARYTFGQDYTNAASRRVVAAGADTVGSSCTSAAVTFVCG